MGCRVSAVSNPKTLKPQKKFPSLQNCLAIKPEVDRSTFQQLLSCLRVKETRWGAVGSGPVSREFLVANMLKNERAKCFHWLKGRRSPRRKVVGLGEAFCL